MLSGVSNGVNFTAYVIANEPFKAGVKQAKEDAKVDFKYNANDFANAVSYLDKDGTQDVYEVVHDDKFDNNRLLKNGEVVKSSVDGNVGRAAMNLITEYVKFDLKVPVAKPFTPAVDAKVHLADVCNSFSKIEESVAKTEACLIELRKSVDKQATRELHEKLDKLV